MMSKYLQVVWLYVIGIMIIFVGVYLLMLNSGPGSFIVMLVGLGVAAMGSAHGRKMRISGMAMVTSTGRVYRPKRIMKSTKSCQK